MPVKLKFRTITMRVASEKISKMDLYLLIIESKYLGNAGKSSSNSTFIEEEGRSLKQL